MDGGHDLHAEGGAAEHGISPISPLTIATFITAFGAIGLVSTNLFSASDRGSVIWASLGGLVFSFLVYIGFTYLFIKPQGSSDVQVSELTGHMAEVITPIPENGMGEVALIAGRQSHVFSSQQRREKSDRGASVKVPHRRRSGLCRTNFRPASPTSDIDPT
jgi:membrane protein implicated in regulation of membrane protease activity